MTKAQKLVLKKTVGKDGNGMPEFPVTGQLAFPIVTKSLCESCMRPVTQDCIMRPDASRIVCSDFVQRKNGHPRGS